MGSETVEILPEWLRRGANHLTTVQGKLHDIIATLDSNTGSLGEPWGADSYGDKFANGAHGYVASKKALVEGGDGMVKVLGEFATGLDKAATMVEQDEDTAAGGFHRAQG